MGLFVMSLTMENFEGKLSFSDKNHSQNKAKEQLLWRNYVVDFKFVNISLSRPKY